MFAAVAPKVHVPEPFLISVPDVPVAIGSRMAPLPAAAKGAVVAVVAPSVKAKPVPAMALPDATSIVSVPESELMVAPGVVMVI